MEYIPHIQHPLVPKIRDSCACVGMLLCAACLVSCATDRVSDADIYYGGRHGRRTRQRTFCRVCARNIGSQYVRPRLSGGRGNPDPTPGNRPAVSRGMGWDNRMRISKSIRMRNWPSKPIRPETYAAIPKDALINSTLISTPRSHVQDFMIASLKSLRIRGIARAERPSGVCERCAGRVIPHYVGPATLLRHSLPAHLSQTLNFAELIRASLNTVHVRHVQSKAKKMPEY